MARHVPRHWLLIYSPCLYFTPAYTHTHTPVNAHARTLFSLFVSELSLCVCFSFSSYFLFSSFLCFFLCLLSMFFFFFPSNYGLSKFLPSFISSLLLSLLSSSCLQNTSYYCMFSLMPLSLLYSGSLLPAFTSYPSYPSVECLNPMVCLAPLISKCQSVRGAGKDALVSCGYIELFCFA